MADPMTYEFLDRKGALDLAMGILSSVNQRINERIVCEVDETDEAHVPSSAAVAKAIQKGLDSIEPVDNIEEIVERAYEATRPTL